MNKIAGFLKVLVALVLLGTLSSCYVKHSVSEEKLAAILTDLYLADATMMNTTTMHSLLLDSTAIYKTTFDKHHITVDEFRDAMHFYMQKKPLELGKIYNETVLRLEKAQLQYEVKEDVVLPYNEEEIQPDNHFYIPRWLKWNNYSYHNEILLL